MVIARRIGPLMAAVSAAPACGQVETSAAGDAAADTAIDDAALDVPWASRFDAATYEIAPSPGMYPPNGPGPCDESGCANIYSACIPGQGWCCGGYIQASPPHRCICGETLGCMAPQRCCEKGLKPRCTEVSDCR